MTTKLKSADIVIVGLGWTGGILAKELADTGLSKHCTTVEWRSRIQLRPPTQHPVPKLEGFQVRTVDDVDLVRREMEMRCRAIGRKVALVVIYDGFHLDPVVSDAYFSMITYMQSRYYSSASRYTTSGFMRIKLGSGLAERNLKPHVFETPAEAHAFAGKAEGEITKSLPQGTPIHL